MGKNVLAIDDMSFEQEVLASEEPFLLDFTATWCGPCKMLAPIVESIADENVGKYRVGKLDIDASPATAARFGIRGAPTVIVFKAGKEAGRQLGVTSKQRLLSLLRG
ncbi:MAG: thioredoxin [Polyangiales bacterium]